MGGGAEAAGDRPARAHSAAEKSEVNYMDYLFSLHLLATQFWSSLLAYGPCERIPALLTSNLMISIVTRTWRDEIMDN